MNVYLENGITILVVGCFFYSWWENRKERKEERRLMVEMHQKEKDRLYDTIDALTTEFKAIHEKLDVIADEMRREGCECGDKT